MSDDKDRLAEVPEEVEVPDVEVCLESFSKKDNSKDKKD